MTGEKRAIAQHLVESKGDCRYANCSKCPVGSSRCEGMSNKRIAEAAQRFLDEDETSFQSRDEMLEELTKKLRREGRLGRDERLAIVRR